MNRYDPIEYQRHSLLFHRPDSRMGLIDYSDRTMIKSPSALTPDREYREQIIRRQEWFCSSEIKCYDGRDFVDTREYAEEIWREYVGVTIAFSATLWAVDLAAKFEPPLTSA
ncbi:MAG TPA: hypothetical protein VEJ63_23180 [Planctomycetota bacterium]|nr:hypothetical protein [Planctomycetota bacterium]